MTLVVATSGVFPYVCGIWTCRCGRKAERHGRLAAVLPPGWVEGHEGEPEHICGVCAERRGRAKARRP